jgi:hypothetical protein
VSPLRRVTSWLASPRLAAILLLVVGVWSFLGTLVPQGYDGDPKVEAWRVANRALAPLVSAAGFHQAFASPLFVVTVLLLAASTAVCSWRRTKVAIGRHRLLSAITDDEAAHLAERPTFSVDLGPEAPAEPLAAAADALHGMGLRASGRDEMVVAASRPWAVFGSPVFHWALLLLILVIVGVRFVRADGLMGVPVGDSRPLAAESFGFLDYGALYRFSQVPDSIRVDRMDIVYMVDGIDRGPAPTVSIVRPDGSVAASQVVYPNNPMRYGSLIIHPSAVGLSPGFAIVSKEGTEGARTNLLVDFDDAAPQGTKPADFTLTAASPQDSLVATVTVPLQKSGSAFVQALPDQPRATFTVRPAGGGPPVASGTLLASQELKLPNGSRLRLLGVGYYARLSIVDDPAVPLIYALLLVGLLGVSISILGRQSLAVVTLGETETGERTVYVWFRDWRANKVRAAQAEEAMRGALEARSGENGDAE